MSNGGRAGETVSSKITLISSAVTSRALAASTRGYAAARIAHRAGGCPVDVAIALGHRLADLLCHDAACLDEASRDCRSGRPYLAGAV